MTTRRELGQRAEELAARFLVARGYRVLHRNHQIRSGELDLVARSPDGTVCFVEVRARAEARAVFAAAGIVATPDDDATAFGRSLADVPGVERPGGSTTQSLARGSGLETNDINGEVVALGRMHGVPTPVNVMLQRLALRLATERPAPGSIPVQELERTIG